jgi:malonyl-CoA decarboxylase
MKDALLPLCAYYLSYAKRGREPLDAVARFHLGNGAKLDRLNWLGDTSPAGMRRSAGLTVNYVYDLADIERNHEAYSRELRVVASSRFERLARKSPLGRNGSVEVRDSELPKT